MIQTQAEIDKQEMEIQKAERSFGQADSDGWVPDPEIDFDEE